MNGAMPYVFEMPPFRSHMSIRLDKAIVQADPFGFGTEACIDSRLILETIEDELQMCCKRQRWNTTTCIIDDKKTNRVTLEIEGNPQSQATALGLAQKFLRHIHRIALKHILIQSDEPQIRKMAYE